MIMYDNVSDLILKVNVFMSKKGNDINARRDLINAINTITGEDSLDTIYVNETDNFNLPDVVVMPLYHKDFNLFLMDGDVANTCPFGYTIEINHRCFTKYTAEELTAVIIHDILQNVQSYAAKTRFLKAYNNAISQHKLDDILDTFDDVSNSEIMFMIYMDICCRPFRVPAEGYDYVGTDEVLKSMKLDDAYDSYLDKYYGTSLETPDDVIENEIRADFRTANTVINACRDKDIRHYYDMVKNGVPLITLDHIFATRATTASLGFVSRMRNFKKRYTPVEDSNKEIAVMSESFMNPKTVNDYRFQIDKIIMEKRYAENESEREVVLIKIRNLTLKLIKLNKNIDDKLSKDPANKMYLADRETVANFLDELESLRKDTVSMNIKEKRYGIWVKYPVGYEG